MHRIFYTMEFNAHNVLRLDSYRSWAQSCDFLWVKTPCKILEPYDNPFWEKSNPAERERRENNAVNSGALFPWQRTQPRGQKFAIADILSINKVEASLI